LWKIHSSSMVMFQMNEVDFTFRVFVTDNSDQVDSLSVLIRCIDQKPFGGFVSGRLMAEDSPYFVASNLVIDHEDTLTIEPGCEFIVRGLDFPPTKRLRVYVLGRLIMSGTEEDTIKFSPEVRGEEDIEWDGFRFFDEDASYRFEYLQFTIREAMDFTAADRISISHCLFSNYYDSTAARTLDIENCNKISIHDNKFEEGRTYITHCGTVSLYNNLFQNSRASVSIVLSENVLFERNLLDGASLSSSNSDTVNISRCVFINSGAALNIGTSENGVGWIINCTINNAKIHTSSSGESSVTVINSTFSGDYDYAILDQLSGNGVLNVLYSNFFGYDSVFRYESELGEGCISEDPQFVDHENEIFWLSDGSQLIDAGHPDLYLDPDTSRADLGAYFWAPDGSTGILKPPVLDHHDLTFAQYPNPFNGSTTFTFSLNQSGVVNINLFDVMGRHHSEILSRNYNVGNHKIGWDGSTLPSGEYLIQLTASEKVLTRKIILLR